MKMDVYVTAPHTKMWLVDASATVVVNPNHVVKVQKSGTGVTLKLLDVADVITVPNITIREFLSSMKALKY